MRFTFKPAGDVATVLMISFPALAVIVAAIFFLYEMEGMYKELTTIKIPLKLWEFIFTGLNNSNHSEWVSQYF